MLELSLVLLELPDEAHVRAHYGPLRPAMIESIIKVKATLFH